MKTWISTAVLAGGLIAAAPMMASAATPYECEQQAQQYAEAEYPTGGGAARGAAAGGVAGGVFAGLTGGRLGRGVLLGGGAGLVVGSAVWLEKKQDAHDSYLAQCMQASLGPAPATLPPTPFSSTISVNALNVRAGAGTQYGVLWQIKAGQVFEVLSCASDWCWINQNGANGYVAASYLYPLVNG
jgi:uncharacterized protein YgiM (DUF1202 family)